MKKILIGVIITLSMTSYIFADVYPLEESKAFNSKLWGFTIQTVCVDDYKFVILKENMTEGVEFLQHFSVKNGVSVPTKC